jgi:hypothetical protein
MQIIVLFAFFVVALNAIAVAICSVVEQYSTFASLLAFLGMFVLNFLIAWQIALWITERYLLTEAQREKNEQHAKWANSLYRSVR